MLNINKKSEDKKVVFELEGRLDTVTAPALEQEISGSLEGTEELILDLDKLDYISSAGLRVMLAAYKIMQNQGQMKVIKVNDMVMDVFEMTGFSDILTIE